MGVSENFRFIFQIIAIIGILCPLVAAYLLIKRKIASNKDIDKLSIMPFKHRAIYNVLSVLCILIVGLSWVMNLGWLRVIFVIPMIIYAVVFYFSNSSFHRYNNKSSKSNRLVNYSVYVTYLLYNILLPDFGDTEDSIRVFFGLIKNEMFLSIAFTASGLLLITNIVLLVFQAINISKAKGERRNIRI